MVAISKKRKYNQNGGMKFWGKKSGSYDVKPKINTGYGSTRRGARSFKRGVYSGVGAIGTAIKKSPKLVTTGLGAVAGLTYGTVKASGKVALGTVKALYKLPALGVKKYLEIKSRQKLREKLGVDVPQSEKALSKFTARQKAIDAEHTAAIAKITAQAEKNSSKAKTPAQQEALKEKSKKLIQIQIEKKLKNSRALLTNLSAFHEKKGLGGISTYKTSWGLTGRRSKKQGATEGYESLLSQTNKSRIATPNSTPIGKSEYNTKVTESTNISKLLSEKLEKAQTNLTSSVDKGRARYQQTINAKKQDPAYLKLQNNFKNKQNLLSSHTQNSETIKKEVEKLEEAKINEQDPFKKIALNIDLTAKKRELVKSLEEMKKAEMAIITAEKALLKKEPKTIDEYAGQYYRRKESRKNYSSNYSLKNIAKTIAESTVKGARLAPYSLLEQNPKSKKEEITQPTKLPSSQFGFYTSFDIKAFGIDKIKSKHHQSREIENKLFQPSNKTLSQLDTEIEAVKKENPTDLEGKKQKLIKLQSLISDKNLRSQLLRSGEKLAINLINEEEFKKYKGKLDNFPTDQYSYLTKIISTKTPNEIKGKLDEQISRLARLEKTDGSGKITEQLQIMKKLYTYYNSKDLNEKIKKELEPQRKNLVSQPTVLEPVLASKEVLPRTIISDKLGKNIVSEIVPEFEPLKAPVQVPAPVSVPVPVQAPVQAPVPKSIKELENEAAKAALKAKQNRRNAYRSMFANFKSNVNDAPIPLSQQQRIRARLDRRRTVSNKPTTSSIPQPIQQEQKYSVDPRVQAKQNEEEMRERARLKSLETVKTLNN